MGNVITLNYFKHKPNKNFVLTTTTKGTYPVHLLDERQLNIETPNDHEGLYWDHFFDCSDIHMSTHRFRADDISSVSGNITEWMSAILPEVRARLT